MLNINWYLIIQDKKVIPIQNKVLRLFYYEIDEFQIEVKNLRTLKPK